MMNEILLKTLCELPGTPGREQLVAEYIMKEVSAAGGESYIDPLGNVLAFKKGNKEPKNRVMFTAHMDEVGFVVTYINDEGMLRFAANGGVNEKALLSRRVLVGESEIKGVIGSKPIHLTEMGDRDKFPEMDTLYIDIGASSKKEVEELVKLGDFVVFDSPYERFGDGMIASKAFDDRAGCAIMLEMIKNDLQYDTFFAFTTQEEVGGRGAAVASFTVKPDIAVVLETTTAADNMGLSGGDRVCVLKEGPVVSYMDRGTIYDKEIYELAVETAREQNIPVQTKTGVYGGNDAAVIHRSLSGIKPCAISVPSRNLHTPCVVAAWEDFENTCRLAMAVLPRLWTL